MAPETLGQKSLAFPAPACLPKRVRVRSLVGCALSMTLGLFVYSASAAKWEITPTVSVQETYTDNVGLEPAGAERSEWITQLKPGISVVGRGPRLRVNAAYAPQGRYYAQAGSSTVSHQLKADSNAELVDQLLFLDARAAVTQQNISLLRPQAVSNVNTTGNRTNVRTFLVSPYLRHDFGYDAQGEIRLTYSAVDSGATASFSNSRANRINMRLVSGPAHKLLTWSFAYNRERIDYTNSQHVNTENFSTGVRRLITPRVGLLANVGYENDDFVTTGPTPKGTFWSAGLDWTPTPRTRLAATTGRRFFGATRSLRFNHRTRLTVWSASYSEDITNASSQFFAPPTADTTGYLDALFLSRIPDANARQKAVQDFVAQTGLPPNLNVPLNFLSSQVFLVKQWQASAGIQGVRSILLANVFSQTREAQAFNPSLPGAGDFSVSPSIKQTGTSLIWNHRLTAQATSNLSAGYTRNEFSGTGREDKLKFVRIDLTRQFQPRLSGSLSYRRLQSDSNQSGAGYTENAVSAALNMRF